MLVIVAGRRGWAEFCAAIERMDLAGDERFATPLARATHSDALAPLLSDILAAKSNAHWGARFTEHGVMHSVVNESLDFLREPAVEESSLFSYLAQPGLASKLPIPSIPGAAPIETGTRRGIAPVSGADTVAILAELGYSEDEIATLIEHRIAGH
jgi:crotonobetainyl-CoA:carnitine CoA-transferase CaiB-like acyl-CoA transferase